MLPKLPKQPRSGGRVAALEERGRTRREYTMGGEEEALPRARSRMERLKSSSLWLAGKRKVRWSGGGVTS